MAGRLEGEPKAERLMIITFPQFLARIALRSAKTILLIRPAGKSIKQMYQFRACQISSLQLTPQYSRQKATHSVAKRQIETCLKLALQTGNHSTTVLQIKVFETLAAMPLIADFTLSWLLQRFRRTSLQKAGLRGRQIGWQEQDLALRLRRIEKFRSFLKMAVCFQIDWFRLHPSCLLGLRKLAAFKVEAGMIMFVVVWVGSFLLGRDYFVG